MTSVAGGNPPLLNAGVPLHVAMRSMGDKTPAMFLPLRPDPGHDPGRDAAASTLACWLTQQLAIERRKHRE